MLTVIALSLTFGLAGLALWAIAEQQHRLAAHASMALFALVVIVVVSTIVRAILG